MKKNFKLLFTLVLVSIIGINSTKAITIPGDFSEDSVSFPNYISGNKGKVTISSNYASYTGRKYQWQNITKTNYDLVIKAQKDYSTKLKEYADNKALSVNAVINNCGFEKELVQNWCGDVGGPGCSNLTYDNDTISATCKTSLDKLRVIVNNGTKVISMDYDSTIKSVLPEFDNTKWLDLTNDEFSFDATLSDYQVIYTKLTSPSSEYIEYSYTIYDFHTDEVKTEIKDKTEIIDDNSTSSIKIENNKKEDKTNEKNPKTGLNNSYIYMITFGVFAVALYVITRKNKLFSK